MNIKLFITKVFLKENFYCQYFIYMMQLVSTNSITQSICDIYKDNMVNNTIHLL